MNQPTRAAYFDNAKFLLMVLVVFSHLLQPFIADHKVYHDLYYFIFTFHMPAFVFISGYFAKPMTGVTDIIKSARKLLLPYLFFQAFYAVYYWLIGLNQQLNLQLLNPQWSLWFLLSLFFWQLSLLFFQKMSPKKAVVVSTLGSLLAGHLPFLGQMLTLQRTFVFLPFFIIGYYLPKDGLQFLTQPTVKRISVFFLPVIYFFISQLNGMNKYMVFGSKPYEDYLSYPLFGGIVRGIFLVIGLIGILGFFRFVSRKSLFFTKWGRNTLLVYLLQGIFIKGLRALSIAELDLTVLGVAAMILSSLLLTIILASKPMQCVYHRLEESFSILLFAILPILFL